jgi:hypothetical protein
MGLRSSLLTTSQETVSSGAVPSWFNPPLMIHPVPGILGVVLLVRRRGGKHARRRNGEPTPRGQARPNSRLALALRVSPK